MSKPNRPMPDDFAQYALEPERILKKRYKAGSPNIVAWRRALGLVVPDGPKPKQMPAGFAEQQIGRSVRELAALNGCGKEPVLRWLRELGIKRKKLVKPAVKTTQLVRNAYQTSPIDRPHRDMSRAGTAADFLRKFGPVYRCNERGGADAKGAHWRRGSAILTDAELIARAERNGWNPDAWMRIAA